MTFHLLIRSCVNKDTSRQLGNNDKTEDHKKRKILKQVLFKNWKYLSDLIGQTFQQYSRTNSLKKIRSIVNLWYFMYQVCLDWGKEISRKIFWKQCTPILTSRGSAPTHVSPQVMPNWHQTYRLPAGISDLSRISISQKNR